MRRSGATPAGLNPVCLCGHVERSHDAGPCAKCDCRAFKSAYPVFLAFPAGVSYVTTYSSGLSLVECSHAPEHQRPAGGWVGVGYHESVPLIELSRDLSQREAREQLPIDRQLDYRGLLLCRVCFGDECTTEGFEKPVRRLAIVPEGSRATASLFC